MRLIAIASFNLAFMAVLAFAETVHWVGPAGQLGFWSDPANWSPNLPTANSDVLFDLAAPGQPALVDLSGPNQAFAGTLTVLGGGVQFSGSGALNVSSIVSIGGVNQSPEFIIRSHATVNALGGLNALSGETQVGFANTAGTLNVSGELVIGDIAQNTSASFRVGGGSTVNADSGVIESGDATIEASGMLAANQELKISTNSVLRGNGMVAGDVENSGLISPGESIGELTVDGDFVQLDDGELLIELEANRADRLNVLGSATFGGTLRLDVLAPPGIGSTFDTLSVGDKVLGEFQRVTIPNIPGRAVSVTLPILIEISTPGDMDYSGSTNSNDIDDFVVALINNELYMRTHRGLYATTVGNFAEPSGTVDLYDVPGFEEALRDAGVSVSIAALLGIPEPCSGILAMVALCGWFAFARRSQR
jgi:hypothetical protein